ncbi:AAA family ATPase [Phytoactinopolyspora mesophila]|uniref:Nuclease SbcCD subunit C n=1 Tax=Phytoactinopolyspora mesophila TaxID=2650750 RepID=A0A7K3MAS9_9ACTN|nr:AAA family ATPase [Phytoactinopolyspora mesophila]NDL60415.1 AAA family ATPase [Phytoactinopolyspora mesophila]
MDNDAKGTPGKITSNAGDVHGADVSHDLVDTVMEAAADAPDLDEDARLLLLSVFTNDDEMQAELTGTAPEPKTKAVSASTAAPVGAFLKSVTVTGFRGVGVQARLDLHPAPGVTVVAGRNGSGKSTFSEAVEVALTRTSYRWSNKKNAAWRAGWRNLHQADSCGIKVELAEQHAGLTTIGVDWTADSELDGGTFWTQRPGERRDTATDPLGWAAPLELYRPLLSYDELGGILEAGPSKLYDKLSTVLGLGPIADAVDQLDDMTKATAAPRREATKMVSQLLAGLDASQDARAAEAHKLLKARKRDLDAIAQLATGVSTAPADDLAALRALAALTVPPVDDVRALVEKCAQTRHALAELSGTAAEALVRRTALLNHALDHVAVTGAGPCPLCGVGTLDDAWAGEARDEVAQLKLQTEALEKADAAYQAALRQLRSILPIAPPALEADVDCDLPSKEQAADAWRAVRDVDVTTASGPQEYLDAYTTLAANVAELRQAAEAERQRREDLWAPLASSLAEVVGALRRADDADRRGVTVKAAASWLKEHANQLRNERLRPISDHAQQIWAELRQESNVDLGPIEVAGTNTRRRVELSAEVDGHETGALTVMSQGELHALALALFLPRATLPVSPFRFVVVDDPVQAMDPAKVDGLARVLERLGRTHQVVVFTHDNRLPEAIRCLGIDARILEVHRAEGSKVEVVNASDPAQRYLSDAHAVARDPGADAEVRRRIIPVLCRLAVENACRELFTARRYAHGIGRDDVEAAWDQARTTRQRVALVLHDDPAADLRPWIARGSRRNGAMQVIGRDSHHGLERDAVGAVGDVRLLVDDLRSEAK